MDLLTQLGINSSIFYQLGLFLIVFVVLRYLLFAPYYAAYNERKERTVGKTELAERYIAEAHKLEEQYGQRAREVNDRFREIYDQSRIEATKEYDRLVSDARNKTKALVESSRQKIQKEMDSARQQLGQEISSVSALINNKLIGKDLST